MAGSSRSGFSPFPVSDTQIVYTDGVGSRGGRSGTATDCEPAETATDATIGSGTAGTIEIVTTCWLQITTRKAHHTYCCSRVAILARSFDLSTKTQQNTITLTDSAQHDTIGWQSARYVAPHRTPAATASMAQTLLSSVQTQTASAIRWPVTSKLKNRTYMYSLL